MNKSLVKKYLINLGYDVIGVTNIETYSYLKSYQIYHRFIRF